MGQHKKNRVRKHTVYAELVIRPNDLFFQRYCYISLGFVDISGDLFRLLLKSWWLAKALLIDHVIVLH